MMNDAISRKALLEKLHEHEHGNPHAHFDDVWYFVRNAPSINAVPVVHARWERMDEYCNHAREFKCTACKRSVHYDYFTRSCDYDFCPNCGAKMDGVEHDSC